MLHNPDTKVHGANMGPIWGRHDPGGPHVGPMNPAFWEPLRHWYICQSKMSPCPSPFMVLQNLVSLKLDLDVLHFEIAKKENKLYFAFTKCIPYLTLRGYLYGVYTYWELLNIDPVYNRIMLTMTYWTGLYKTRPFLHIISVPWQSMSVITTARWHYVSVMIWNQWWQRCTLQQAIITLAADNINAIDHITSMLHD